jgi:hypothetical protein
MPSNKPKAQQPPALKNIRNCQHIKVTGVQCGGPAMRGEQFCYFHQRMLRGVKTPPNVRLHPIALIEDEESIQASLMEVINALARNHIDLRRAGLILTALRIAVRNSRQAKFNIRNDEMVREIPDYPAPPKPAAPPVAKKKERPLTERAVEDMALQVKARALATLPAPAIAAVAPTSVSAASASAIATKAASMQIAVVETIEIDPKQRKPPARAGVPSTTNVAVNQQRVRT